MIQCSHLYFSYTGGPPYLLKDLNFSVPEGDYISIVGENGCGKSTLLRLLLGFLTPVKGSLSCTARCIGYVSQRNDFANTAFPITVEEVLRSYARLLHLSSSSDIDQNLSLFGMSNMRHTLIGNLSGGQHQKIMIIRALMGNPDLLILDEPSTGVDVMSQQDIYQSIYELNRKNKITVIAVEHNMDAAMRCSSLIYHMDQGRGHLCSPEKYADEFLHTLRKEPHHV